MTEHAVEKWAEWYRDTLSWKIRVQGGQIYLDDLEIAMLRTSAMVGTLIWHRQATVRALICRASPQDHEYWLFPAVFEDGGPFGHPHLSRAGAAWVVGLPWELPAAAGQLLPPSRWWPRPLSPTWPVPTRTELGRLAETVAKQHAETRVR
jgi:hypothetical protein